MIDIMQSFLIFALTVFILMQRKVNINISNRLLKLETPDKRPEKPDKEQRNDN